MLGIFLDSETNGLNCCKHKILEIAYKIVHVETGILIDSYHAILQINEKEWALSDASSLKINNFDWEETAKGKPYSVVAKEIIENFAKNRIVRGNAVFICQNPSFDRAFFAALIDPEIQEEKKWPYHWLDLASMFWAMNIQAEKLGKSPFPWIIGCSKDSIASFHGLPTETKPHRAMNGVNHLIDCYEAVVGFPLKA